MKSIHPFIKAHIWFVVLTIPLIFLEKGTIELWLNGRHTAFLDTFFRYTTFVGDGIVAAIFAVILLTFSYYKTIVYTTSILLTTLLIQGLGKKVLFPHLVRPKNFFPDEVTLNFVENFKTHGYQTFPSGHTGAGFTWLCFLALMLPKKYGLPLFLIALLVGISRVYLLQHFFIDIYAGSIIGTGAVLLSNYYFGHHTTLGNKPSLQKGLLFK